MSALDELKNRINSAIYSNNEQDITGDGLQSVLDDMVDTMGVSVSQNTETGHTDISVGGVTTPVPSLNDAILLEEKSQSVEYLIDGKPYIFFRKRFLAGGYYSPINDYCCTSIIDGNGKEYIFPSPVTGTYKVFQYISDTEGTELTDGWKGAETRLTISGKFIVTFNGTYREDNKTNYDALVASYRIVNADLVDERIKIIENTPIQIQRASGFLSIKRGNETTSYIKEAEVVSKNLINTDAPGVMLGYRQYSDTPQANANYNLTDYIPVVAGQQYVFSSNNKSYTKIVYGVAYTKDLEYIDWVIDNANTYTPASGVSFVRLTLRKESWEDGSQFEKGSTATKYQPYGDEFLFPKKENPQAVFPNKIYVYGGVENSIYHKNYMEYDDENLLISSYRNYESAKWQYLQRCFRTSMTSAQSLIVLIHRKQNLEQIFRKDITTVVGSPSADNGNKKVLCIGDSFTYDGRYIKQIVDLCQNITTIGMREPAQAVASGLKCEGRGGWTLAQYKEPYGDITPTHLQPFSPFVQTSGYTYYGVVPFWAAVVNNNSQYSYGTNGFSDYASWFDTNGYKLNPSVNDLMYDGTNFVFWNGSSWEIVSSELSFSFDFAKYLSTWQITAPDFIFIFLGKNDFHEGVTGWAEFKQNLDELITSIHSYSNTIKIGICTPTTADEASNNSDNRNAALCHRNMWNARKNMISDYDGRESEAIYLVDTGVVLDPDYGFVMQEQKPFTFYEGDERILFATNGVHPSGAGYKQIGTSIAGFIQAKR